MVILKGCTLIILFKTTIAKLQNEEEKLLIRLDDHNRSSKSAKKNDEMFESDLMVGKLFFSSKLMSLSPGIQFDPSLRYFRDTFYYYLSVLFICIR